MRASVILRVAAGLALLSAAAPALHAQHAVDSTTVVIRLGSDTTAVERWIRGPGRLESVLVNRVPRTVVRRLNGELDNRGRVTRITIDQDAPRTVTPTGVVPTPGGFYAPYALALAAAAQARDSVVTVQLMSGTEPQSFKIRRIGPDAFEVINPAGASTMRARLNRHGKLLFLESGTSVTVEAVAWRDIDAVARNFSARDQSGQSFGPLSPADTVRAQAAGANLSVAYSRPAARGRTILGGLVPFGQVWRTGANDPTVLETTRPVRVGDLRLEPGKYELLTIPGRSSWELIVNRAAAPGAAAPATAQEVGRATMTARALNDYVERFTISFIPAGGGATLELRWENTAVSVPIVAG
jgi:hypothetical protein